MMDNSVTVLFFLLCTSDRQELLLLLRLLLPPPAVTSTLLLPGPEDVRTLSKKLPDDALKDFFLFFPGCVHRSPLWVRAQHL